MSTRFRAVFADELITMGFVLCDDGNAADCHFVPDDKPKERERSG
jgi:hypothetical protein